MTSAPQDLAQVMAQSQLSALDWLGSALPGAALVLAAAALVAIGWMCWSEVSGGRRLHDARLRHS